MVQQSYLFGAEEQLQLTSNFITRHKAETCCFKARTQTIRVERISKLGGPLLPVQITTVRN